MAKLALTIATKKVSQKKICPNASFLLNMIGTASLIQICRSKICVFEGRILNCTPSFFPSFAGNLEFAMLKRIALQLVDFLRFHKSYSQDGEDMVLRALLEHLPKNYRGFFIDVGAHHPVRFSNTYHFYRKGWRGINIDATPGSMRPFGWLRRRDINLELGIGAEKGSLTFYCFDEPALNTLSEEVALERAAGGRYKITKKVEVPVLPLREVLNQHLPNGTKIDFLSVDVEGMDEMVLRSNDWQIFRPAFVLAEDTQFDSNEDKPQKSGVYAFLVEQDYKMVAKTPRTLIFKDSR